MRTPKKTLEPLSCPLGSTPGQSPTALIHKASEGHRTAAGLLIQLYDPLLVRSVRRYLGPRRFEAEGEDLLQTIRMALFKGLPKLREKNRKTLVAWVREVVKNRVVDWERKRRACRRNPQGREVSLYGTHPPQVQSRSPTPSRIILGLEDVECLRRAIEDVPLRYRDVLRFLCEKSPSPQELAVFLGKAPEAARKFAARALSHLKAALKIAD